MSQSAQQEHQDFEHMTPGEAAVWYAQQLGWRVVPIRPRAKTPLLDHWPELASTNLETIRAWWRQWRDAGAGIVTGAGSGVVVLDIDPDKGGEESLRRLVAQYGELPDSVEARTGGGGRHIFFRHPGCSVRNSAGKPGPVLDIRGDGGYIVAAPSVHQSGQAYEWKASRQPGRVALARMPGWLLACVCEPRARRTGGANGKISPGERNDFLASRAGAMRRRGLSTEDIAEALLAENAARCEPPLPADEVWRIAVSISQYEPSQINDTDMANAVRMAARYGQDMRYTPERGWLIWDGQRWCVDEVGQVVAKAKATVRHIATELANQDEGGQKALFKWLRRSQSAACLKAMVNLAKTEPGIPARLADFDVNPLLLNCQNGTVNLTTGGLHAYKRADSITCLTDIVYRPEAPCPNWLQFLNTIMAGDEDMIAFLQRAIGYTLTGLTAEQCLFFLYGTGANGKSAFLEIIDALTGDYGAAVSTQTIMVKKFSGIPNDIARLAGKRFAAVGEIDDGSRMSESLIKDMTGSDTITARFLRREFFDFKPQFKLWIRGNHKPQIRGTDEGIWRRLHLIPFTVRIPEAQRDPHLLETLRAELPGILAWAVRGALEYHHHGLAVPAKVKRATQKYREEMDVIGEFLTDRCVLDKAATVNATELYQAYRGWCESSGNDAVTQRKFGTSLGERGYTKKANRRGIQYYGLRLRAKA